MPRLFFDEDEAREIPVANHRPILLTQIIAGAQGPSGIAGPAGPQGPAGPAPTGTGFVKVDNGVLEVPAPDIDAGTF